MEGRLRNRQVAASLALLGALTPGILPLSGLHKFYMGQPFWGVAYLLLGWTQIPRIACAIEGVWYLSQNEAGFRARFGGTEAVAVPDKAEQVSAIASALRELDQLRQEGLISEYEFEQKRRVLLDQVS
ncbi:MAG: SHOCT domain-containing protein [Cyanobacteria bacterium Co-bin13]|nr:SHOCT domain-containing protein [Cyanobacteria bacterium Co-bin13]